MVQMDITGNGSLRPRIDSAQSHLCAELDSLVVCVLMTDLFK